MDVFEPVHMLSTVTGQAKDSEEVEANFWYNGQQLSQYQSDLIFIYKQSLELNPILEISFHRNDCFSVFHWWVLKFKIDIYVIVTKMK